MIGAVRYALLALVAVTTGLRPAGPESCDVIVAALAIVGADSSNAILIEKTGMGVPQFAFNGYSSIRSGDTSLARTALPELEAANRARISTPLCLRVERGWVAVDDSVLFAIFRGPGDRWAQFHDRYPGRTQFVLVSQPVVVADTAVIYIGIARGKLEGHGAILRLLRAPGGRWSKASEMQLWVS